MKVKTKQHFLRKSGLFLIITASLLLFSACSSVTTEINTSGNIQSIQKESVPFGGPQYTALAKNAFENGTDIQTDAIESGSVTLNYNLIGQGILGFMADIKTDKKLKLKVTKDTAEIYYDVPAMVMIKIPLQLGNGHYEVELFSNLKDTQYQRVFSKPVDVNLADAKSVYLYSNEIVNFDHPVLSENLSLSLTQDKASEPEKVSSIYQYVIEHITYDYKKITAIDSAYIPDPEKILQDGKGICYDYAAVFAALLREAGIPAKLVKGYRDGLDTYHAWNEVCVDGQWLTVDTTFDAAARSNLEKFDMVKDARLYKADKAF